MTSALPGLILASLLAWPVLAARTPSRLPQPEARFAQATPAAADESEPIEMQCPAVLGTGVTTNLVLCDVIVGLDPAEGILLPIPEHRGTATLTFDLHNRHTYSEAMVQAGRAYTRYTATVVLANLAGEILGRATVHGEFRAASDLFDRASGGAGPGGLKAVAPVGLETVIFEVPSDVTEVVVLGERLVVQGLERREVFSSVGRPVAILSNPTIEY